MGQFLNAPPGVMAGGQSSPICPRTCSARFLPPVQVVTVTKALCPAQEGVLQWALQGAKLLPHLLLMDKSRSRAGQPLS